MSRHLHPDHQRERDVLNPIFMFVHGKSFAEMNTLRKTMAPNHCCGMHGHRMVSMQSNPWTAELGKQAWRDSGKRGKRSGGRKGGGRVKEGEMNVSG